MKRRNTLGSLAHTVRRLAAYIPTTLAAQILRERTVPTPGKAQRLKAASLFCDLSGFTAMTVELEKDGPRGAEELNRILLMTFTVMINAIHTSRGAVAHFYGDAMLAYFPDDDGEAAARALACARFMINLMERGYSEVSTALEDGQKSSFRLAMKIGVGYGSCAEIVVGEVGRSLEFVVGGNAINEAVTAQLQAGSNEVIASKTILERAGLSADADFRVLTEVMPVPYAPPLLFLGSYDSPRLRMLVDTAAFFMHPSLNERIMGDKSSFVAEHRPVTSMFVMFDGIDFEEDNAGELLQQYYDWAVGIVARYGSENARLNRVLTGDKGTHLHILFGAPVAPESPAQAIRCAIALQNEKPDFIRAQKIGLAAGNAFAGAIGSGARREYTAIGEVVNLSARLANVCPVGSVVTNGATARRIKERFEFELLEAVPLKGFETPVPLYRVQGERLGSAQFKQRLRHGANNGLAGRDSEQETLLNLLQTGLSGQGAIVSIVGPVGIGRSRLLEIGVNRWQEQDGITLVGIAEQHTTDVPYGLWLNIWRDFFEIETNLELSVQAQLVVDKVRELCPFGAGDVGLWVEALGLPVPPGAAAPAALTAEARQARFFSLIQRVFEAAAVHEPIMFALEDVHWADQQSIALLNDMALHIMGQKLVVAMTVAVSEEDVQEQPANLPAGTTIHLNDVMAIEGRIIAQEILQIPILPTVLERYLGLDDDSSRINPVFIEESIGMLLELGVIRREGQLFVDEEKLQKMRIPDSINSLLLARLDRLSASSRTLIQAASVIGRQFDVEMLRHAIKDLSPTALDAQLAELDDSQMIYQVNAAPKPVFLFRNDMIREVAYNSVPYARRQTLHATIANSIVNQYRGNLQPFYPVLAYHYSHTDLHEFGLEYAVAAGDEARLMFASKAAIELYTLAERHIIGLRDKADWKVAGHVLLSRAEMRRMAGQYTSAIVDAERVLTLAEGNQHSYFAARACNLLAELKSREAPGTSVLELANKVVNGITGPVPPDELANAWATRGEALAYLGDYEAAHDSFELAHNLYRDIDEVAGQIRTHILWALDFYVPQNEWQTAAEHLQMASMLIDDHAEDFPEAQVRLQIGHAMHALHEADPDSADRALEIASKLVEEREFKWWQPAILYYQSKVCSMREDTAGAHATLHLAMMSVQEGGCPDQLPLILLSLAELTSRPEQSQGYLTACSHACRTRAPYVDRVYCHSRIAELMRPNEQYS